MYTANKIHVAERDEASLQKTRSGGVSEPSDPSHFPLLSSIDSPRAMSRLKTSFKDRLLTDSGSSSSGQTVENGPEAGPGASWTDRREGGQQDVSPKMLGGRDTDRALEAATSEGRGHVSETRQLVGQIWLFKCDCIAQAVAACYVDTRQGILWIPASRCCDARRFDALYLVAGQCKACWG